MKKLRCTSCGAELKVEDNKEYAICEHCGSKYKLNEDLNINIKIDDSVKDVINNGLGTAKHFSKFLLIPVGLFVVVFISILVFSFKTEADFNKKQEESRQQMEEKANKAQEESEKYSFNFQFTSAAGTDYGNQVERTLDDIIESNKNYDRKVKLVFNGESTTDESKIIEIKHSLGSWDEYEVIVNKDADGYVSEIKVDKIG